VIETTAMGAAFLAGLAVGYWDSIDQIEQIWQTDRVFEPSMSSDEVGERRSRWQDALQRAGGWEKS
jgi:glycerol kinase